MRRDNEDKVDPNKPALIVIFGNTRRRCRPLDRDVFVLGRAPGCDLGLVSPEVASVHCVLIRFPSGWRIRDCSGRGATRVNGRSVHEAALTHGDVIQVGSFSFETHLPDLPSGQPQSTTKPASHPDLLLRGRLERSRRNLIRHSLRMRARLRKVDDVQLELDRRQQDLEQQEDRLRTRAREQEARIARLLEERHQLEEALLAGTASEDPEAGVEGLAPVVDQDLGLSGTAKRGLGREAPAQGTAAGEEVRRLEIRARELAHYVGFLRRHLSQDGMVALGDTDVMPGLAKLRDELHERNEEVHELRERLARHEAFLREDQANYEADLHRYRQELQRDRDLLEEQRQAVAGRQAELDDLNAELVRRQAEVDRQQTQLVRQQAEVLQQQAELRKQLSQPLKGELGQKLEAVRKLRQSLAELHGGRRDGGARNSDPGSSPDKVTG